MSIKHSQVNPITSVKSDVKAAGQKAAFSPLMELLTRLGYGVRGVIYIIMGLLALSVALGKGGAVTDQQGAIASIGRQPAGLILLWVILIGLVSYSLWGVIRALLDPLHKGHDLKGLVTRAGFLLSAASYGLLSVSTYSLIKGAGQSAQNGAQTQRSIAMIMAAPWGRWVIGIAGLVIIGVGMYQIVQGFKNSFDKQIKTYAMNAQQVRLATQLGRFGTAARGFVLAVVGGLLCLAAYQSNANQPVGFDAALSVLLRQPYGIFLLAIVAIGLIAFGVYSVFSAAWFRSRR